MLLDRLDIGGDIAAPGTDVITAFEDRAIAALQANDDLMVKLRASGLAWGAVKAFFMEHLPESLEDRSDIAYHLVSKALTKIFGVQGEAWHSFKSVSG